jgi:arylsulfatase A-like enzyme
MQKQPHIIIFNPDQWRGDVLAHKGNSAAITPNLDRIVKEDGVSFANAFCQNPVCTPSRCSFMSGWYPHTRGHRTMSYMMQPDEPVLLKTLKENGYFVWWGGKNDLVPAENGFENYCDIKYSTPDDEKAKPSLQANPDWRGEKDGDNYFSFYKGKLSPESEADEPTDYDWSIVRGAIDMIKNYKGEKPLCIFLALAYPHPPYAAEEPWCSMIDRQKVPERTPIPESDSEPGLYQTIRNLQGMQNWTDERWQELRATYYASCARVDHQFGMVIDALKQQSMYDDTALFFFSDHGDFTGDYGVVQKADNVFPDCLTCVPFIIKPPSWEDVKPRVSQALVELTDLSATVAEMANIKLDHTHFSCSLMPVISGQTEEHRDAVFCEGGRRLGEEQCKGLELIPEPVEENLYWSILKPFRTECPEIGKSVMIRTHEYKYVHRLYETDELYNLKTDPREYCNCINDPSMNNILQSLKSRLMEFYLETGDVVSTRINKREL